MASAARPPAPAAAATAEPQSPLGTGDTSLSGLTLGGGSNIASLGTGTGGTGVTAGIGNTNGDLITTNTDNGASANVNLGSLGLGGANDILNGFTDPLGNTLDGVDLGGLPAGGGGGAGGGGIGGGGGGIGGAFAALSPADQRQLRIRCVSVLGSPGRYNANTVALCRLIARL